MRSTWGGISSHHVVGWQMLTRRQTLAAAFLAMPAASCGNKATARHHDLASRIVGGIINPTLEHLHGDGIPVSENARALLFAIRMAETGLCGEPPDWRGHRRLASGKWNRRRRTICSSTLLPDIQTCGMI